VRYNRTKQRFSRNHAFTYFTTFSFDRTASLAGHGSLSNGATADIALCSNGNGSSGEHVTNQRTFGAHGESRTENPIDIGWFGAVDKHNFATGTSREGSGDIEDEKSDSIIGQSDADG
jgi:hypothetical protein